MFTVQKDNEIMSIIGADTISHPIAQTNHGPLSLLLRKGDAKYQFVLDAVPLSKEKHDALMDALYPIPQPKKPVIKKK